MAELLDLPEVLIIQPPPPFTSFESDFTQKFNILRAWESSLPLDQFLTTHAQSVQALLCHVFTPVNGDLLRLLPALKLVVSVSTGANHVDKAECRRRGIAVTNAGNAYSEDVADMAVGLFIDVNRIISAADWYVRRGLWSSKGDYPLGSKVFNTTSTLRIHFIDFFYVFNWVRDWVLEMIDTLSGGQRDLFFMGLWAIWTERNKLMWNDAHFQPMHMIQWTTQLLEDYQKYHPKVARKQRRPSIKWQNPPSGRLKINVDGAFNTEKGSGGIGVVVRNDAGMGIAALARTFLHAHSVLNMEAEACRAGLLLGIHQGWTNIDVESDSAILISALNSREKDFSEIGGKRVGIVGLGNIGYEVAKRLEGFGCKISYNSRSERPSLSYPFYSNVCELAANSDALIICCALTDQTRHMINKEVLSALGKDGVVVNIGRGAIIDEKQLVKCLVNGEIRGAGLDVFENEPHIPKELVAMDNVVLSPHKAVLTLESFKRGSEVMIANLEAFFSNKPLVTPVMD